MKKITRFFFTFIFVLVGMFGMGSVNAKQLEIKYITEAYEYYLTGTDKLNMKIITSSNDTINAAINKFYLEDNDGTLAIAPFYPDNSGTDIIHVVPFELNVIPGKTWNSNSDSAQMQIRIPKALLRKPGDLSHTYLLRVNESDNTSIAYDVGTKYPGSYEVVQLFMPINGSNSSATSGFLDKEDFFITGNRFAILETSDFDSTGKTYYMLVVCNPQPESTTTTTTTTTKPRETTTTTTTTKPRETTTTTTTTKPRETTTITTTTTKPGETTTTTIENPKTADVSSELYIVIGAICLASIVGLGVKFAKAGK